jgi:nicotinate-nucleotide adenylyltransferase
VPAHRPAGPGASDAHRLEMIRLAAAASGEPFRPSDLELTRSGTSYTADTLRALHDVGYEPWRLFFLAGADAFAEIATWREYPALLDLAHFAVCSRPGTPVGALAGRLPALSGRMVPAAALRARPILARGLPTRVFLVDVETPDVSSTLVRARARAGLPMADLVPPEVAHYISRHGLYVATSDGETAGRSAAGTLHE